MLVRTVIKGNFSICILYGKAGDEYSVTMCEEKCEITRIFYTPYV